MSGEPIPEEVRATVRAQADDRCGYCLSLQCLVYAPLEIEHLVPRARGGSDDEDNLWLACRLCNNYKGTQIEALDPESGARVRLFDPRHQEWSEHFEWDDSGTRIVGRSAHGRATVIALQLNNVIAVAVRRAWVPAGWHPPADTQ